MGNKCVCLCVFLCHSFSYTTILTHKTLCAHTHTHTHCLSWRSFPEVKVIVESWVWLWIGVEKKVADISSRALLLLHHDWFFYIAEAILQPWTHGALVGRPNVVTVYVSVIWIMLFLFAKKTISLLFRLSRLHFDVLSQSRCAAHWYYLHLSPLSSLVVYCFTPLPIVLPCCRSYICSSWRVTSAGRKWV